MNKRKSVLAKVLAVGGAAAVTLGVMASPAHADMKCTGATGSNVCLTIDHLPDGRYHVRIGIDAHMSRAQAQQYIDHNATPFRAEIVASDISTWPFEGEHSVYTLNQQGQAGASDEWGLSANFEATVDRAVLNEDQPPFEDDEDDIYAQLTLLENGQTFKSPKYNQRF
ncbi:hypothetical protein [Actinoplanes sp. NPDC049265]|uniref:hypothetical protein n=1 Tax=Actinoplanes sp. NPDC049265 TaxID=3363902 RepID=UPI00371CF336